MASLFKRRRNGKLSQHWWASWRDHRGKPKSRSTGSAVEADARLIASRWESDDTLCREGHREHVERLPLRTLQQQYELKLSAADNSPGYVEETLRMIGAICDDAGWKLANDIHADGMTCFLMKLKSKNRKPRTLQKYARAAKGFTGWLVKTEKLRRDPLASIQAPTPGKGNRRMLLPDEWSHLEAATAAAARFGMRGAERVLLYRVAIETGLRSNELRQLTRSSLVLDAKRPYIVAEAGSTKNRKRARQHIRADLAAGLRAHVASKLPTAPLFAMPDKWKMANMLRADLAAARKAWIDEARRDPDELIRREQSDFLSETNHAGQALDFHSLRHTCGAWLLLAGATLNVVQSVMRHSTITLTIDTYGHLLPGAEADAVDGLAEFFSIPELEAVESLKTGTDDAPIERGRSVCALQNADSGKSHASDAHSVVPTHRLRKSLPCDDLRGECALPARELQMSPAGVEPTTYGLKVRCSTN